MQTLSRRAVGYAALGVTLAVLFASPILAQSVSGADPAAFDVSGVRLGMSVNDAIAALKRFEPGYAITKQYWARSPLQYGNIAHDMKELDASDKRVAYLWDLEIEKDEQKQECDYNSYVPEGERETKHCWMAPHAVETVTVWFSPIPGQERVIAVMRKTLFEKQPQPAIVSLKSGAFAKYSKGQATYTQDDAYDHSFDWIFDSQKRLMSTSSAKAKYREPVHGDLPETANAGEGLGLNVFIDANRQSPGLAVSMTIVLYDANALYRSVEQSEATYKALKAKADAEDVSRSKGQNQPKF